jgi:beta-hydroxylase
MPKEPSRRVIKSLLAGYHALLTRLAPEGTRGFFEPEVFPWIAGLEREWRVIRTEFEAVRAARGIPGIREVEPGQDDIATDDWRWLVLFWYRRDVPENCERCPRTAELLRGIPSIQSAMFSVFEPGMHVPPHHGPFKGVLRYHLGLVVPGGGRCGIRVGQEFRSWREGGSLVFDDTLEHEAWNDTQGTRVVLFVDFVRPLPWPLSAVNQTLLALAGRTPAVRNAQANARRLAARNALS